MERRFANPPGGKRKDLDDLHVLLDATGYYDVVDFHSLSDYSEIPATVKWLREEMAKRGVEKEIFIGDAVPMSPLLAYGLETCQKTPLSAKEFFPVTEATRCEAAGLIAKIRAKDPEAVGWLEENVAVGLVRKLVVSAGEGIAGINVGNLEDWEILFTGAGTSQFFGMIDRTVPLGDQLKVVRTPGEKRPAFFSLEMAIQNLDRFDAVRRLPPEGDLYLYEFTRDGKKAVVAWHDDGGFSGLGKETPEKEVTIPWEGEARVQEIPAVRGQDPPVQEAQSAEGKITLKVGSVPVFITAP